MPFMMSNVAYWHARKGQIVIAGPRQSPETLALERSVARRYLPFAVVVPVESGGTPEQAPSARLPWLSAMAPRNGQPSAYVCHDFTCRAPVSDAPALDQELDELSDPRRIVRS